MADQLLAALVAVSILLGIAGIAGGVYANFKSTALEASNKRLTTDNDYYLKKIGYLEPKMEQLERENETFRTMINPASEITALREQEAANHKATYERLGQVKAGLDLLHADLQGRKP